MGNLVFNSKDSMQNLIKLVNEAAEAVGKVFGGGKGTGAFVLAAPVAALIVSGVADYIDDKQQKQIQAEKERLQKEAISKQAALIQALRDDAQMSRERQDYLECLNQQLQKALEDFQREAVQDRGPPVYSRVLADPASRHRASVRSGRAVLPLLRRRRR